MIAPAEITLASIIAGHVDDPAAAAALAAWLETALSSWKPPTTPVDRIGRIVAYAFGNRPKPPNASVSGDPLADRMAEPGPINEALARAVCDLIDQRPVCVYAQWEVAGFVRRDRPQARVVSVEPVLGPDGALVYLSTQDVARAAVAAEPEGGPGMGVVAVVAHRDHAGRCVEISRAAGMDAYVAEGVTLPADYDPLSGQTWTRRRDLYLLHDLCAQLAARRAAALIDAYPAG